MVNGIDVPQPLITRPVRSMARRVRIARKVEKKGNSRREILVKMGRLKRFPKPGNK